MISIFALLGGSSYHGDGASENRLNTPAFQRLLFMKRGGKNRKGRDVCGIVAGD